MGRPKGAVNLATRDVKRIAQQLVTRTRYVKQLEKKLDDGTLHPSIQVLLWQFAYGKPKETIEHQLPVAVKIFHEFATRAQGEIIDGTPQKSLPGTTR